jgi:hypothetical protein
MAAYLTFGRWGECFNLPSPGPLTRASPTRHLRLITADSVSLGATKVQGIQRVNAENASTCKRRGNSYLLAPLLAGVWAIGKHGAGKSFGSNVRSFV